ncbi:pyruvate kinase domain protein [Mycobacteroides abscessus 5S-1212]|uniref:Pyruvate kinase domain protein n=1 Tax=Mycobacteroides abscessus subsp. bolletii 1513 TaxID=1299321 RepID=X8DP74_9MYCO|nr:pyruvate kinase domain protein [Mycobacteroides abscessus 5S-1212]EUA70204.1 pyruvate kinase domain protein [Mycobacteroides abscessus subsp. bolletii 1513]
MAEVQPCDVHTGLDERTHKLGRTGRRAKGTNDLSASRHDF